MFDPLFPRLFEEFEDEPEKQIMPDPEEQGPDDDEEEED
jgi:hypothetical protein